MSIIGKEIYEKVKRKDRGNYPLVIDRIYLANPNSNNLSGEVISKLLNVKNQGGFRYTGTKEEPKMVVLFSTGEDIYWKDEINSNLGVYLYYGDNKTPGNDMHKTNLHGNEILRNIFNYATSEEIEIRKKIPPIFVFKKTEGRNVKFLGLVVPGIQGKPQKDWLTAVWGQNKNGDRFQNYKAYFSILNTDSGSEEKDNSSEINLMWLNDIEDGNTFNSIYAPKEWKNYILDRSYKSLVATSEKYVKSKEEQLPDTQEKIEMLKYIHNYFISKDGGYSFEPFACNMIKNMDEGVLDISTTSPYKDGGIDGIGIYRLFLNAENRVNVDFYVQAKCHSIDNGLTVGDTSRLISRIKNRQFGILFTTSYISKQAYEEILSDKHPIVIINGKNIIDFIFDEYEIKDLESLKKWMSKRY